jgi:SAM-dependent methyltransferase
MDRYEQIKKHVTKEKRGIEIGAWHSGIAPKRLGYRCLILDVFDTETLGKRAHSDGTIPAELIARIEEVDLVGSSTAIAELVEARGELGQFDYIVSSHNLEHCPDPVTFFQGCERVLKPDGYLSMIVPDKRGCFDFFRPTSTPASIVAAYLEKRSRPTEAQVFEQQTMHARRLSERGEEIVFPFATNPREIVPYVDWIRQLDTWKERIHSGDQSYKDTHCWVFTPASFELIMLDLGLLGLTKLSVDQVQPADGEFFVHLRNSLSVELGHDEETIYKRRRQLLLQISDEASITAPRVRDLERELASIRESTGWRVTSPFRMLSNFFRKVLDQSA